MTKRKICYAIRYNSRWLSDFDNTGITLSSFGGDRLVLDGNSAALVAKVLSRLVGQVAIVPVFVYEKSEETHEFH